MKNLSDIAREMGISKSTISRIYNNKWRDKQISAELAARVMAKILEEGAQPNQLGAQLRSGRTQTAGVLLPNLAQPYFLQLISGLQRRLSQDKCVLLLGNPPRGNEVLQTEFFEDMAARCVDRLIVSPLWAKDFPNLLSRTDSRKIPVVFVNNYLPQYDIPYVVSDNVNGTNELVRHVIENGRKRILFVGASQSVAVFADRESGYRKALGEAGLKVPANGVMWRDTMRDTFEDLLEGILLSRKRPDAIVLDSLFLSDAVIFTMHKLGLKHPEDVLICGFDYPVGLLQKAAFRETVLSPLMTVRQNALLMGEIAGELALYGKVMQTGERQVLVPPAFSWQEVASPPMAADEVFAI